MREGVPTTVDSGVESKLDGRDCGAGPEAGWASAQAYGPMGLVDSEL